MNKYIVHFRDHGGHEEFDFHCTANDFSHAEEKAKDYSDAPIAEIKLDDRKFWLHKYEVAMAYGGSEEGGWWYDTGNPTGNKEGPFDDEEKAYERCRELNEIEHEESEKQEYSYSSVLSHRSEHFAWDVDTEPVAEAYPKYRPHYE